MHRYRYTAADVAAALNAREAASEPNPNPSMYGRHDDDGYDHSTDGPAESLGQVFVRSGSYKAWKKRFPSGGPPSGGNFQCDPIRAGGWRALVTSADASAGTLIRPDFAGLLEPGLVRPLRLRDLITVQPVNSDSVEWLREASRISAAAPVGEATGMQPPASLSAGDQALTVSAASVGIGGLKPEGGITWEQRTAVVRTFASWVPATRRAISDAPQLRSLIDKYLTDDLLIELEDQMLAGNGTGENFLGLLNDPAIPTVGPPGAGESFLYSIRTGIRRVRVEGRTDPNGIVMHPADAEGMDLLEVNDETNHFVGSGPYGPLQRTLWGVPVVESDAIPVGTTLVGDFRRAVLFDREAVNIAVGTVMDDFIRNIVRVLGEMRAAFAIVRPTAFVEVDLAA
jgi:HK97 family phage major capsid protein